MGISKRLLIGLVALAAALPALASPAAADTLSFNDANDTSGRLDIRRVVHRHAADGRLKHRVSTYSRFRSRALRGHTAIVLILWAEGQERLVIVHWGNGRLRAQIIDRAGHHIRSTRVTRPNRRSVVVWLRPSDLGDPPSYRWQAATDWHGRGACSELCIDHAPNRRYLKHVLEA